MCVTRNSFDEVGARALLDNLRGSKELEFLTLDKTLHLLRGEHQVKKKLQTQKKNTRMKLMLISQEGSFLLSC